MIFWQLFYTFLIIGAFTFGGGYSMVALIEGEVVSHYGWMTATEFADLLAVSQMTPGPVGINTATYAGYTAVLNAGYPWWAAVGGSLLASLAVVIVPVALVMLVSGWLLRHKEHPTVAAVMKALRLAVVGLIAAAALQLFVDVFDIGTLVHSGISAFGEMSISRIVGLTVQLLLFAAVFWLSYKRKASPIVLILASGAIGLVVYTLCTTS